VRRGAIVRVVTIGLLAAAAATAVAILVHWLPDQDSKEGERIDFVFWFVVAICIGVFAVGAAVSIYSVVKFRARPDDDSDGPPIHGHTGLEIAWTAIPAVLVTLIAVVSTVALAENGKWHANRLKVEVRLELQVSAVRRVSVGHALAPGRPAGRAPAAVARRDPFVLGPGVPPEAGRRPGRADPARDHADEVRQAHAHLHGALRARPRAHACAGGRAREARIRPLCQIEGRALWATGIG